MTPNTVEPGVWARRSDIPIPEVDLDADLAQLVRRTALMRQAFYCVVLLVALAGQVSGAVETLHIPLGAAVPAVAALELGGIVVLANADVRRRLGERALFSRILSAGIATWAVAFNWLAHSDHLLGAFFASMSALGYLIWLLHVENQRRDRLRVKGDLPPTTPAYEAVGHWTRHPWLTLRARALAKADPRLGLYDSIAAARAEKRRERREAAIAKVLHKKIKAAVDPNTADIAIAVYDLDQVAQRLAERADYDGLTALIQADLAPSRIAPTVALQASRDASEAASKRTAKPRPDALADAVDDALRAAPGRTTRTRSKGRSKRAKRTRTDADLLGELAALAEAGARLSVRNVQRSLNVGAPKARTLLAEFGVIPADDPAVHVNGHSFDVGKVAAN